MILIIKGDEPNSLALHRVSGGSFSDFSQSKGKTDVQNALRKEQLNLCAYCNTSIFNEVHIEHWCPQKSSKCIGRELEYRNLLGVCRGQFNNGINLHCDKSRTEGRLLFLNPLNKGHIDTIRYDLNQGKIHSTNSQIDYDLNSELNLNFKIICANRRNVYISYLKVLKKRYGAVKSINWLQLRRKEIQSSRAYNGVILYFVNKKIFSSQNDRK